MGAWYNTIRHKPTIKAEDRDGQEAPLDELEGGGVAEDEGVGQAHGHKASPAGRGARGLEAAARAGSSTGKQSLRTADATKQKVSLLALAVPEGGAGGASGTGED